MSMITRLKFHTLRYKGEIVYGSGIIGFLMIMVGFAFPKDNAAISGYVSILSEAGLDALFATIDVNAPGWLFWVSLMSTAYIYIVSVIVALRIGARLFPMEERSALELIASSPKPAREYYIENILAAILALIIVFIPSFLILSAYSLTQNAADTIPRLAVLFILSTIVALFYASLTSIVSVLRFSSGAGTKVGYLYLFFGFMIELGAGSVEEYSDLAKLSVNTYVAPASGLLNGEHNWLEAGIVLLIAFVFLAISVYIINRPDYIENVSAKRRYSFTFLPKFSPKGRLAKKYPILFDQFRKDRSYMFIWSSVVIIAFYYIALIFDFAIADDPTLLTEIVSSFGGFLDIFTFGHPTPASYAGFLSFEVMGVFWVYYGLFIFFPAIGIAGRDQKKDEQDSLWSNSITPTQVIVQRTLAIIIYFSIFYWVSAIALWSTSPLLGLELDTIALFASFGVGYIYHLGLMLSLIAITLFLPIRSGRTYALRFYMISIALLIVSFLQPSVDFLRYFSIVYYYDPVGILLGEVKLIIQVLNSLILIAVGITGYVVGLKAKYQHTDLLY